MTRMRPEDMTDAQIRAELDRNERIIDRNVRIIGVMVLLIGVLTIVRIVQVVW